MSATILSVKDITPVPPAVLEALRSAERIALAGHVTPDADCLGVIGAMQLGLRQLGKQTAAAMPAGSVSRKLQFMVDLASLHPAHASELAACDAALIMDTAKEKRVNIDGKLEALPSARIINVDHHASNTGYGDVQWIEGTRSSSCEMVYEILRGLACEITPEIATLLYAGIHSDTQGFSLSNTTSRALQVAHELAECGANVVETCEKLCRSYNASEFALLKVIYANTRISEDGRLGWSTADYDEIHSAGCTAEDIDDQVEVVRSIEGVRVAILFTEGKRGKVRMNFRGDRGLPVLDLAKQFGGGGHDMAAGAILDGTVPEVAERVLAAAREYIPANA
ncbi:MAG: bifunctional oligoribonuclease/PAP phosphatase NrnA [Planctomycetota bacterium]|nr:MAG: bifunctional oligoribonuclease/PAP phosphatase NrnA [Planctomycetota bacterium]